MLLWSCRERTANNMCGVSYDAFLLNSLEDILLGSNITGKYLYSGRQTMKFNWKILLCVPLCDMPCSFVDENKEGSRFRTKEVQNAQIKPSISLVRKKSFVSKKKKKKENFSLKNFLGLLVYVMKQLLIQRSLHYLWNVRQPVTSAVVSELEGVV